MNKGKIHLYEGKGESEAALGIILRKIGFCIKNSLMTNPKEKVFMLRFPLEKKKTYFQDIAIEALQKKFPLFIESALILCSKFFSNNKCTTFDKKETMRGWDIAKGAIVSNLYSLIFIENIQNILEMNVISEEEITKTLNEKPDSIEIIITGKNFPKSLIALSDVHIKFIHSKTKPFSWQTNSGKTINNLQNNIEVFSSSNSIYALGKALQAIGKGISQDKSHRVLILQWLGSKDGYSEDASIEALRECYPNLVDHLRSGRDEKICKIKIIEQDYIDAERAWEIAKAAILSGLYKTIILDKLNTALDLQLLSGEEIYSVLLKKNKETKVIITGNSTTFRPPYLNIASSHLRVKTYKHYLDLGINPRPGIDF